MDSDSQAKRLNQPDETALERLETFHSPMVTVHVSALERIQTALAKCTDLMERHLAAGEKTVPARALYFILRDVGYGRGATQKQEIKQAPQQQQQPTNQLHHNYGMRR